MTDAPPSPDLATLAKAAKATVALNAMPGTTESTWTVEPRGGARHDWEPQFGYDIAGIEQPDVRGMFAHRAVAEFIAAANPDAVLALLAEIERLTTLLAKYENYRTVYLDDDDESE